MTKSSAAAATAPEVVMLKATALVPHPQNPRGKVTRAMVEDLLPVIDAQGQRQPCLVRPLSKTADKFQIVLGHRRAAVGRDLGRAVPCIVEDLDDDQALAIMLADNPSHLPPDPMLESRAVAAFLSRPNWTLQSVAEALGKSPRWVAQRANLQNLTEEARSFLASEETPLEVWPVSWLERVAALAPEAQVSMMQRMERAGGRVETLQDLEEWIAEFTNKLSAAPWDLDDATLFGQAGSCSACPKTSARSPGLFDDGQPAEDIKKALCRDLTCWKTKLKAHQRRRVKELQEKHEDLVALVGQNASYSDKPKAPPGLKLIPFHGYTVAKKGDRGALPGLVVCGDGAGQLRWVKVKKAVLKQAEDFEDRRAEARAEAETKNSPAAIEAREAHERKVKREGVFAGLVAAAMRKVKLPEGRPGLRLSVILVAAYSTNDAGMAEQQERLSFLEKAIDDGPTGEIPVEPLWDRAIDCIAGSLEQSWGADLPHVEVRLVASLLGLDVERLLLDALEEVPEPSAHEGGTPPLPRGRGRPRKAAAAPATETPAEQPSEARAE